MGRRIAAVASIFKYLLPHQVDVPRFERNFRAGQNRSAKISNCTCVAIIVLRSHVSIRREQTNVAGVGRTGVKVVVVQLDADN